MDQSLQDLLKRQRNRAIKGILDVKETECDLQVSARSSARLRKAVLDEINNFSDFVYDLLESVTVDGVVLNEAYLERIDALFDELQRRGIGHGEQPEVPPRDSEYVH